MRIKFNDKIYRLKEIESGVDSLMELVEERRYKDGDFFISLNRIAFIFDREGKNGEAHYLFAIDIDDISRKYIQDAGEYAHCGYIKDCTIADQKAIKIIHDGLKSIGKFWNADKKCVEDIPQRKFKDGDFVYEDNRIMIVKSYPNNYHANVWYIYSEKPSYDSAYAVNFSSPTFRYATDEEKKLLIDAMKNDGKRWNAEKLEIEDIPQPKFKVGDSVKIKEGISSKTHRYAPCSFVESMDKYIGKKLIVDHVAIAGRHEVLYFMANTGYGYYYDEDWLEPWIDEPKIGDWVIAWDVNRKAASVGILEAVGGGVFKYVVDGLQCMIAVKWDGTKEHLEKIRKG